MLHVAHPRLGTFYVDEVKRGLPLKTNLLFDGVPVVSATAVVLRANDYPRLRTTIVRVLRAAGMGSEHCFRRGQNTDAHLHSSSRA